jgi:hypothetical protein
VENCLASPGSALLTVVFLYYGRNGVIR